MRRPRSIQKKAIAALKEAVRDVVKRHQKTGRPLAVWQNGKVVKISATRILQNKKRGR